MLTRRHLLAALPFAHLARPSFAADQIGVSVKARGTSSLQRGTKIAPLTPGVDLYERDVVRTAQDGFAELLLNIATQINLGPQSEVEIDRYVASIGGQITLGGAMAFDRPEDLAPVDVTIRSAFAQIGVRGTRFFAGPSNGPFAVFVDRGMVTVTAGGVTRILRAGEGVSISAAGAPAGEVTAWKAKRITEAFASVGLPPTRRADRTDAEIEGEQHDLDDTISTKPN